MRLKTEAGIAEMERVEYKSLGARRHPKKSYRKDTVSTRKVVGKELSLLTLN